eukprot:TRINITY_DN3982_c0_g1_i1.p1 TRINITY_DN3982_c0_g1~~TRINITY_DN3982_c0_g1_i1.p1  ORF type:complete len:280 (-),score=53.67 TRINITY_DN3982_c0_g1_i1:13-804(-)
MGQGDSKDAAVGGKPSAKPATLPPEAQTVPYSSFSVSPHNKKPIMTEEDMKKMIQINEAPEEEEDGDNADPIMLELRSLPKFFPLFKSAVDPAWREFFSKTKHDADRLDKLHPAALIEILAKFQTYAMKSCLLTAKRQDVAVRRMRHAENRAEALQNKMQQQQDAAKRMTTKLSEVHRVAATVQTTHSLLREIINLIAETNQILPPTVRSQMDVFGYKISADLLALEPGERTREQKPCSSSSTAIPGLSESNGNVHDGAATGH